MAPKRSPKNARRPASTTTRTKAKRPASGFRPPVALTRMSRGDEAAQYVRTLIFDGELAPGSRVPQDDIAAILGVSRIPVREALITLESEGWVTIELNRGAFVNGFDAAGVRDHYELFGMVYGFAARRALARSPGAELAPRLEDLVRQAAEEDDLDRFTHLAFSFNKAVVDAAHSPRIKAVARGLGQLVPGTFFELVPQAVAGQVKGMRAVARAVRKGDAARADAEFQKTMRAVGETVAALFETRGLLMDPDAAASAETSS